MMGWGGTAMSNARILYVMLHPINSNTLSTEATISVKISHFVQKCPIFVFLVQFFQLSNYIRIVPKTMKSNHNYLKKLLHLDCLHVTKLLKPFSVTMYLWWWRSCVVQSLMDIWYFDYAYLPAIAYRSILWWYAKTLENLLCGLKHWTLFRETRQVIL